MFDHSAIGKIRSQSYDLFNWFPQIILVENHSSFFYWVLWRVLVPPKFRKIIFGSTDSFRNPKTWFFWFWQNEGVAGTPTMESNDYYSRMKQRNYTKPFGRLFSMYTTKMFRKIKTCLNDVPMMSHWCWYFSSVFMVLERWWTHLTKTSHDFGEMLIPYSRTLKYQTAFRISRALFFQSL